MQICKHWSLFHVESESRKSTNENLYSRFRGVGSETKAAIEHLTEGLSCVQFYSVGNTNISCTDTQTGCSARELPFLQGWLKSPLIFLSASHSEIFHHQDQLLREDGTLLSMQWFLKAQQSCFKNVACHCTIYTWKVIAFDQYRRKVAHLKIIRKDRKKWMTRLIIKHLVDTKLKHIDIHVQKITMI